MGKVVKAVKSVFKPPKMPAPPPLPAPPRALNVNDRADANEVAKRKAKDAAAKTKGHTQTTRTSAAVRKNDPYTTGRNKIGG